MQVSADEQISKIIRDLNVLPEEVMWCTGSALNHTADHLKKEIVKGISREQRIKASLIRDRIEVVRSSRRSSRPLSKLLIDLKKIYVKNLSDVKQTPIGVRAGGIMYPHAFIADLRKARKSKGVYRRVGKERFPVKSVTISIFEDVEKRIEDLTGTEAKEIFEKDFLHMLRRRTGAL